LRLVVALLLASALTLLTQPPVVVGGGGRLGPQHALHVALGGALLLPVLYLAVVDLEPLSIMLKPLLDKLGVGKSKVE
jgi:hypothetical protein